MVPDHVVALVHGRLEELVAELPLDADADAAAGVLQELVYALLDLKRVFPKKCTHDDSFFFPFLSLSIFQLFTPLWWAEWSPS